MIDQNELMICWRRGHNARISHLGWSQCSACGTWLRETRTVEEREDEPPEDELAPEVQSQRALDAMKTRLDALGKK